MTQRPFRLTPDDAGLAAALHAATMEAPWSEESFRELMKNPMLLAFGYRGDHGGLDALLMIRALPGEAEIYTIAVAPGRRREGVASALLAYGLAEAGARDVEAVFLEVDEGNDAARALYAGFGFAPIGRRKGYYRSSSGADAILMRLDLPLSNSAA